MHNVEIFNCSQINTMKAAIRFEGASGKWSHISGCSLHNGHGWAINIVSSANVKIENNVAFSFKPIGLAIMTSSNITIDNNIVAHIYERVLDADFIVDRRAAYTICALLENDKCRNIKITRNIAAGAAYAGFVMPGHDCGVYDDTISHNIAHSIEGFKGGMGAVILPDASRIQ